MMRRRPSSVRGGGGLALALALCACGAEPERAPDPPPVDPTPEPGPALDVPCSEELTRFDEVVNRPVLVRQCAPCHNPAGPAAQSRLHLSTGADDAAVLGNYRAAATLARSELEGTAELLLRASDRHPRGHPGGQVTPEGSEDYAALAAFVGWAKDPACDAAPPPPERCEGFAYGPRLLRRLSRAEYDGTLEVLLGRTSTRGASLTADPLVEGFDNHAPSMTVGGLLADQLRRSAEQVALQMVADLEAHLPCAPTPETAADCRDLFVRRFVSRAFRRPITDEEQARYVALFEATKRGDFARGVRWVVSAALQSPHFLYRSELGAPDGAGRYRLDDYEIASALSYFLTGQPPDETLRALAEVGRLGDSGERARQARRLLSSPAGQRHVTRFFTEWLALDRIHTVAKDPETYPGFGPALRASMAGETERFVRWVLLREGGSLPELLTAPYSFVDRRLESHYDEVAAGPADEGGYRRTEQPGRRFGLLTQGSLLTVHAKPSDASPVHRGKLVRERLLCDELEPPPPGLVLEPPPVDPSLTTRERYAAHSELEPCRSCHRLIDPIGFGFGAYDGVGRFRETEAGAPVDARGEIVDTPSTDGTFEGLAGLAALLAASPDVHRCFSSRLVRWGLGLRPEEGLECLLEQSHEAFEASGLRIDALLVAIAASEHLEVRAGP